MRLTTPVCTVRDWQQSDKAALLPLANNRNVWRNLTHLFPHPYTDANADQWFARLASMSPVTHWVIEADGQLVGGIGLILGEGVHSRSAQLGYRLGEPFWGRGIATAAVQAMTAHALPTYSLCRIEAAVFFLESSIGAGAGKSRFHQGRGASTEHLQGRAAHRQRHVCLGHLCLRWERQ